MWNKLKYSVKMWNKLKRKKRGDKKYSSEKKKKKRKAFVPWYLKVRVQKSWKKIKEEIINI